MQHAARVEPAAGRHVVPAHGPAMGKEIIDANERYVEELYEAVARPSAPAPAAARSTCRPRQFLGRRRRGRRGVPGDAPREPATGCGTRSDRAPSGLATAPNGQTSPISVQRVDEALHPGRLRRPRRLRARPARARRGAAHRRHRRGAAHPRAASPRSSTSLARADLVRTPRGTRAASSLARPAADITVRDVFEAVDGPLELHRCVGHPEPCEPGPAPPTASGSGSRRPHGRAPAHGFRGAGHGRRRNAGDRVADAQAGR